MMYYYGYGGMMVFGAILMILFWIAVIWLIVWVIKQAVKDKGMMMREERHDRPPLDIAKERLAKGEMTKKEFDEIKKDLT